MNICTSLLFLPKSCQTFISSEACVLAFIYRSLLIYTYDKLDARIVLFLLCSERKVYPIPSLRIWHKGEYMTTIFCLKGSPRIANQMKNDIDNYSILNQYRAFGQELLFSNIQPHFTFYFGPLPSSSHLEYKRLAGVSRK